MFRIRSTEFVLRSRAMRWVVLCLYGVSSAHGQDGWRFWTPADGMTEAYTQSLAVAGDGSVWARHGSVNAMSVLDGYTVAQIPEPRQAPEVNWLLIARVHADRLGEAWTVEDRVLKQWVGGRWVSHGAPAGWATPMRGAVPMGEDRVWVLFEGQLAEYRPSNKAWRVLRQSSAARIGSFTNMLRGVGGDLWIGGATGRYGWTQKIRKGQRWARWM